MRVYGLEHFFFEIQRAMGASASQVRDTGIWIGGRSDALDEVTVARLDARISHVLNAARDVRTLFDVVPSSESQSRSRFAYLRCDLDDLDDLRPVLPAALRFMRQALGSGGHVLVHCRMGMNRSAALVLAYMVLEMGVPCDEALRMMRESRPVVQPGAWFVSQIQDVRDQAATKRKKGTASTRSEICSRMSAAARIPRKPSSE